MDTVRKINEELGISGQISLEQLSDIADEGYKSILNLRSPEEEGYMGVEQQKTERLGMYYVNTPFNLDGVNRDKILQLLQQVNDLPKPVLIHCDNAIRSAALALIYIATRQGMALERAYQQAIKLGLL